MGILIGVMGAFVLGWCILQTDIVQACIKVIKLFFKTIYNVYLTNNEFDRAISKIDQTTLSIEEYIQRMETRSRLLEDENNGLESDLSILQDKFENGTKAYALVFKGGDTPWSDEDGKYWIFRYKKDAKHFQSSGDEIKRVKIILDD